MASESKQSADQEKSAEEEAYEFHDVEDYIKKLLRRVCGHVLKDAAYDHVQAREQADSIVALVMERILRKGSNLKVILHATIF